MELAHEIKDILAEKGIDYSLPLEISATTTETRQNLENNLLSCHAVIVLFDNSSPVWVRKQLLYCQRMQSKRDQPLKVIAVCCKSQKNKSHLNINLRNMHILECPTLQAEKALPLFFKELQL